MRVHSERNLQVYAIVLQASETNVIKCLTVNKLALPKLSTFPSNLVHQSLTLAPETRVFCNFNGDFLFLLGVVLFTCIFKTKDRKGREKGKLALPPSHKHWHITLVFTTLSSLFHDGIQRGESNWILVRHLHYSVTHSIACRLLNINLTFEF